VVGHPKIRMNKVLSLSGKEKYKVNALLKLKLSREEKSRNLRIKIADKGKFSKNGEIESRGDNK